MNSLWKDKIEGIRNGSGTTLEKAHKINYILSKLKEKGIIDDFSITQVREDDDDDDGFGGPAEDEFFVKVLRRDLPSPKAYEALFGNEEEE